MGNILIDKLLHAVRQAGRERFAHHRRVSRRCSAWTAACGSSRPNARAGRHRVALMKSITPDRCQQELAEVGGSDFGFAFGDYARFRVSVFKQRGNVAWCCGRFPTSC